MRQQFSNDLSIRYPNYIVWKKDFKRQQAGLKTVELNTNNISQIKNGGPYSSTFGLKRMVHVCAYMYSWYVYIRHGFPGGTGDKEPVCQSGDIRDSGGKDPLEEGIATHSRILAWRTPWTEEPGGLQSPGWPRVRHDWRE